MHPVKLLPGIFAVESACYVEQLGMVVISDLQLGREEELRSTGYLVLDQELRGMKRRLQRILHKTGAKRLLINGDLKHEFARINRQEWNQILDLFDFFKEKDIEVILVKGNHDNMLEPIARKREYVLVDHHAENSFYFCHGHELPGDAEFKQTKVAIIGHEHPALRFDDGVRRETAKCFLAGKWRNKQLVVLPSFSEITEGTDMLEGELLGPFLNQKEKEKMSAFAIVENTVLRFGTLRDVKAAINTSSSG